MAPDRELIDAFQQGQVSRRTFIRRLLASGVSLASAMVYADALWGSPVQAAPEDDFYWPGPQGAEATIDVTNFAFVPSAVVVAQGSEVSWRWPHGQSPQHALDGPAGFFDSPYQSDLPSEEYGPYDTYTRKFWAAGIFQYRCPDPNHPPMEGVVEVPMIRSLQRGPVGTDFLLTWAAMGDLDGEDGPYLFDVEVRRIRRRRSRNNAPARWRPWQVGTRAPSATFTPRREGRFKFRARLRRGTDGAASDWSREIGIRAT